MLNSAKFTKPLYSNHLQECYDSYINNLRQIAAINLISRIAEESFMEVIPTDIKFNLSDNFDESATTVFDDNELIELSQEGHIQQITRQQAVISMCSLFEHYVNNLFPIINLCGNKAKKYINLKDDFNLKVSTGNETLRKIYFIIKELEIKNHPFEHEQPIKLLGQIISIRNVLVHTGGVISQKKHDSAITNAHRSGNQIQLGDNAIDDFLHRFVIHMRVLTSKLDDHLSEIKA